MQPPRLSINLYVCVGMVAGATGAFIGTPAEVSLIRMTSDGRLVSVYIKWLKLKMYISLQTSYI